MRNTVIAALALVTACSSCVGAEDTSSESVVRALTDYLAQASAAWASIPDQPFADSLLSKAEAESAKDLLLETRRTQLTRDRAPEMQAREIAYGELKMPVFYETFGQPAEDGRSLFISLHGGGGAPKRVNDRQWQNQQRLYSPSEGVYAAPRAPTDTWNLWHQSHIMPMFDRLIENMVLFEAVNPNKVYLLGYSAGGDGVYQLAPRMADRWAAAAMMAGHPNDAQPVNLRNIGFAIYMGGKDAAYNRNQVAAEWEKKLKTLRDADPGGYPHLVTIYPEKGHWMDREDASALTWMANFRRDPLPKKIIWRKDANRQDRFYWLGADPEHWKHGEVITAVREGQTIKLTGFESKPRGLSIYLNDDLADLDKPIELSWLEENRSIQPKRTIATIHRSLSQRFDPASVFTAVIDCDEI